MKFTVVIPTRERPDTLEWSLKTCVSQDFDDFEIIVSDNASQDKTAELVRSFSDSRINYINTGRRVGMSQNWEFALGHVQTGYVFFMGDDDGLLPDAIQKADRLLAEHRVDALTWKKASYAWPSHIDPNARNCLVMPLRKGIEIRNSRQMLQRVCAFDPSLPGMSYEHLPGLYNSFVSISAIDRARDPAGRFFCSQIPDVYSAVALTATVENYIYSNRPLSINGASGHSNGTSFMKNPQAAAAKKFLSEDNIPFHADLLLAPSMPVMVAESVWQVRDNVSGCEDYDVDLERFFAEAQRLSATCTEENRRMIDAALDRAAKATGYLRPSATGSHGNSKSRRSRGIRHKSYSFHYLRRFQAGEVSNVYEASLFCQEIDRRNRVLSFARSLLNRLDKRRRSSDNAEEPDRQ